MEGIDDSHIPKEIMQISSSTSKMISVLYKCIRFVEVFLKFCAKLFDQIKLCLVFVQM